MRSRICGAALAAALACHALAGGAATAQTPAGAPARGGWSAVRVAKWALLGAAVSFGVYALTESRRGDAAYAELRALCRADQTRCRMAGRRYAAPEAEALYGRATAADRRAQIGIIGGQVTLLGSAGLFLYDLRNGRGPSDIPYPSGAGARGAVVTVIATLPF